MSGSATPSPEAIDQAIGWYVRVTAGHDSAADWHEFTLWLESKPENRIAYDHVENMASDLADAIRRQGLAAKSPSLPFSAPNRLVRSRYLWLSAAAGLAAALTFLVFMPARTPQFSSAEYSTRVGHTRSVRLADGSQVDLNTATTIRVEIGGGRRRVTVRNGEVLFHVAKDAAHPFDVLLGKKMVRVLGTVFDVLRTGDELRVTVAEGHVRFSGQDGSRQTSLIAGDQLVYTPRNGAQLRRVPFSTATAWHSGYLIYTNARLTDVVQDLNRYFTRKIVIADATAAHQRFSGVLRIDREDVMLNRLSRLLPIQADYTQGGVALLRTARRKD